MLSEILFEPDGAAVRGRSRASVLPYLCIFFAGIANIPSCNCPRLGTRHKRTSQTWRRPSLPFGVQRNPQEPRLATVTFVPSNVFSASLKSEKMLPCMWCLTTPRTVAILLPAASRGICPT